MSLFNEYQNKNFTFLTKYINGVISESVEMSEEDLHDLLIGKEKLTDTDFVEKLSNLQNNPKDNGLIFFNDENDVLTPICPIPVPVRATKAERAWLYYYIQKPEAALFLESDILSRLKKELEKDGYNNMYPLNDTSFEAREFNSKRTTKFSMSQKNSFRIILRVNAG